MAQFVNIFDIDLQQRNDPLPLRSIIGEGDINGLRVGARVFDGGEAVTLGGQCVGYAIRADGTTVPLTGTVSSNTAYVVLDQQTCAVAGPLQVAVMWVSGNNVTTLIVAYGTVVNTQTGTVIQPGDPIPDLTELLAEIDAMREATADAEAAAADVWINKYLAPSTITTMDDIEGNTIYSFSSAISGAPFPGPYTVITNKFTSAGTYLSQMCISWASNRVAYRYKSADSSYSAWTELTGFVNLGTLPDGSDLNNIGRQCIYHITAGQSHIPTNYPSRFGYHAGYVFTFIFVGTSYLSQIGVDFTTGEMLYRAKSNNVWGDWVQPVDDGNWLKNSGIFKAGDDLNALNEFDFVSVPVSSVPDNYPLSDRPGVVISDKIYDGTIKYQLALPYNMANDALAYRAARDLAFRYYQNTWSDWAYVRLTKRNHGAKYYAFGDSITWGYSSDASHAQSPWNYPFIVGDLIGVDVHNAAVPGQGLIKNWTSAQDVSAIIPTINDMISNGDFDNTVLITVGWAYNDASLYSTLDFGNPSDPVPESTTGITTVLGYYCKILDVLQKAAPSAAVMLVTGYGSPTAVNDRATCAQQFTNSIAFRDVTKTYKQFYDALEEMANYHGYYCINQANGTVINKANCTTIIGDNIHPTYDNYRIYGNFLASRIAAAFQNI